MAVSETQGLWVITVKSARYLLPTDGTDSSRIPASGDRGGRRRTGSDAINILGALTGGSTLADRRGKKLRQETFWPTEEQAGLGRIRGMCVVSWCSTEYSMPGTRIRDKSRASREDRHGLTRRLNERAFLILYFVRGGGGCSRSPRLAAGIGGYCMRRGNEVLGSRYSLERQLFDGLILGAMTRTGICWSSLCLP